LWCVLLAAGGSRRLGKPKQLVRLRSRALLLRAADAASAVAPGRVVVVLGAHALKLQALLRRHGARVRIAYNPRWREGMASSLSAGVKALPVDARAALFTLTDQPHVTSRSLRRLVRIWQARPGIPAAARYCGHIGVPAILPRRELAALHRLQGDLGARVLLRTANREITLVDMPEAALDIDTAEDLRRL
jgi:molybdenum cofactor cytidylyltransferase